MKTARGYRIAAIITAGIFAVCYFLFLKYRFLVIGGCFLLSVPLSALRDRWRSKKENSTPPNYGVRYCFMLFFFLFILFLSIRVGFFDVTTGTTTAWRYPFLRFYVGITRGVQEPYWFPDNLGPIEGDFGFFYEISWLDPGIYAVAYRTTPENAARIAEHVASQGGIRDTLPGPLTLPSKDSPRQWMNNLFDLRYNYKNSMSLETDDSYGDSSNQETANDPSPSLQETDEDFDSTNAKNEIIRYTLIEKSDVSDETYPVGFALFDLERGIVILYR